MQYKNGCRSPFLYIETVRLFGKNPELLKTMDAFEIHALYYGVMNGLVGQELAERICALAPGAKFFHRLYYRLLAKLYKSGDGSKGTHRADLIHGKEGL